MNVRDFNPNSKIPVVTYLTSAIVFTIVTVWAMVALQSKYILGGRVWTRFLWPFTLGIRLYTEWRTGVPTI